MSSINTAIFVQRIPHDVIVGGESRLTNPVSLAPNYDREANKILRLLPTIHMGIAGSSVVSDLLEANLPDIRNAIRDEFTMESISQLVAHHMNMIVSSLRAGPPGLSVREHNSFEVEVAIVGTHGNSASLEIFKICKIAGSWEHSSRLVNEDMLMLGAGIWAMQDYLDDEKNVDFDADTADEFSAVFHVYKCVRRAVFLSA